MNHYHVMVGPVVGDMAANVRYENYEESVTIYLKLSRELFEGRFNEEDLTIEKIAIKTVDSEGIYIGVPSMVVMWLPCEEEPCASALWS